jgi:hypothetical protein
VPRQILTGACIAAAVLADCAGMALASQSQAVHAMKLDATGPTSTAFLPRADLRFDSASGAQRNAPIAASVRLRDARIDIGCERLDSALQHARCGRPTLA